MSDVRGAAGPQSTEVQFTVGISLSRRAMGSKGKGSKRGYSKGKGKGSRNEDKSSQRCKDCSPQRHSEWETSRKDYYFMWEELEH